MIKDGITSLLIEAGIPIKEIQQGCQFGLSGVEGVLLSHEHSDHSLAIKRLINQYGIDCYTSKETAQNLGLKGFRVKTIDPNQQFKVGSFQVKAFDLPHINSDGTECKNYGYLLYSTITKARLLFATDCMYIPNRFPPCEYYMIECNYCEEAPEDVNTAVEQRRWKSHMSLKTAADFFESQNLSKCKAIYCLHLSENRSDTKEIEKELSSLTNKVVIIAGSEISYCTNYECPFKDCMYHLTPDLKGKKIWVKDRYRGCRQYISFLVERSKNEKNH